MGGCVVVGCVSLGFFQLQKGYGGGWVVQKRAILAWRD